MIGLVTHAITIHNNLTSIEVNPILAQVQMQQIQQEPWFLMGFRMELLLINLMSIFIPAISRQCLYFWTFAVIGIHETSFLTGHTSQLKLRTQHVGIKRFGSFWTETFYPENIGDAVNLSSFVLISWIQENNQLQHRWTEHLGLVWQLRWILCYSIWILKRGGELK